MSENPAAFDALRKAAYSFVQQHGKKEPEALRAACQKFMAIRRAEHASSQEMSETDVAKLVNDVVRWTIKRYNPPKRQPERTREQRAAQFLVAPVLYEMAAEDYGKSTVRNAARLSDLSKSTLGRHLVRQGIAPRRDLKIKKLSSTAQRLVRMLDATFDRRAAGLLEADVLCGALWGKPGEAVIAKTTRSSRRAKLTKMLTEIRGCGIGYHTFQYKDLVAVKKGRRFSTQSETATWIEEELRTGGFVVIRQPNLPDSSRTYFWADPLIIDVLTVLRMATTGHFYPPERLEAIFRFKPPLMDVTPLFPWLERAHNSWHSADTGENLSYLSEKIVDPRVRAAANSVSIQLQKLVSWTGANSLAIDAFRMVDHILDVMEYALRTAPTSYCRLSHLREMLARSEHTFAEAEITLLHMIESEKKGLWAAPDEAALKQYLPPEFPDNGGVTT